ncbi:hypothetical protein GCM10022226_29790 [Sphaerisporangium flaviroseum]|uniref:Uncharacterized protein n=1 Tax=Sphaerisporangium flaviroseum TaxID=509199 RepID=A0ABP7HYW3_9ACTN
MKAFLNRFQALLDDPAGHRADGRAMGLGLATALRKQGSADDVERYLGSRATDRRIDVSR